MQKLRRQWLALAGGVLVLGLSVTSALGANPFTANVDGSTNVGLQVSAFVHGVLVGSDEDQGDQAGDEDSDQDEDANEDADQADQADQDEETDGESSDADESTDPSDAAPNAHGLCVAEVAMSGDLGGANDNHGGAVSEAARATCWETGDASDEVAADEQSDQTDFTLSAKEQRKTDRAAARAERKAAHQAAREDRAAARLERHAAKSGHGHGHGHP